MFWPVLGHMDYPTYCELLRIADTSWNVATISEMLVDALREDPLCTFDVAEKRLRELGSKTYLLAVPKTYAPMGIQVVDVRELTPCDYYLWICLYGVEEAVRTRARYGIPNADMNLVWLRKCGVMTVGK